MADVAELEAQLRARWDREAIEVYGDHLMSIGDPRGELVAMDLKIDDEGATPAVTARRNELIAAWFGERLPPGIVRYGFVDVDATSAEPDSQLSLALRGPGAAYVRSVRIAGPPKQLAPSIELLVAAERPWLTSLEIKQWDESNAPTLDDVACAALRTATPHLGTLDVTGRRVFSELHHPRVAELRVAGFDAIASLTGDGAPWRATSLDFAFHCHYAREHNAPADAPLRALLAEARLPALLELDLSRNEPGRLEPATLGGDLDVFAFLLKLDVRRRLEVVHLPPPITQNDVAKINAALIEMHALKALLIGGPPRRIEHPTAEIEFLG